MKTYAVVGALALLMLFSTATIAMSHIKEPGDDGWYFRGALFLDSDEGREGQADARKDPVNVLWYKGGDVYSLNNVENHYDDNWDSSKVGGSGWRKHEEIYRFCKVDQIAVWRGQPGRDADRTDRHGSTARSRFPCRRQHHVRLWDDYEHDKIRPQDHHGPAVDDEGSDRSDWVLGGIHYDRTVVEPIECRVSNPLQQFPNCRPKKPFEHVPGRSWNVARHEMRRALHRLCGQRAWKFHKGAQGYFQGVYSTGYISRMTTREKTTGCRGTGG